MIIDIMDQVKYVKTLLSLSVLTLAAFALDHLLAATVTLLARCSGEALDPMGLTGILRIMEGGIIIILVPKVWLSIVGHAHSKPLNQCFLLGSMLSLCGALSYFILEGLTLQVFHSNLRELLFGTTAPPPWDGTPGPWSFLIVGCLIGPFVEEMFFRVVLVEHLGEWRSGRDGKIKYDPWLILIFIQPHLGLPFFTGLADIFSNPSGAISSFAPAVCIYGSCAFITLKLYDWTGTLWAGWIVHASANGLIFVVERSWSPF